MFKEVAVNSGIAKGTFDKLKKVADALKKTVNAITSLLTSEGFQKLLGLIADVLSSAFVGMLGVFGGFCQIVEGLLNGDWNIFWEGMTTIGESISEAVDSMGRSIAEFFGVDWEKFKTELGVWVGDLQDGISDFFKSVVTGNGRKCIN